MLKRRETIPQAIREAVDFCPGGLCFSMPDGRPILVNRQMNRLAAALTGHTVLDAEALWTELCGLRGSGGCRRLEKPWAVSGDGAEGGLLGFSLPDGTTWQFRRETLTDGARTYVQTEAADITELYSLSAELYEKNRKLRELQDRQRKLLANIVQVNREKELLSVKMRVHDEFGRCLISTTQALQSGALAQDGGAIAKSWEDAIRDLTNIPLEDAADASQEAELMQVAGMIGCRVEFIGERPSDRNASRLLYAAMREALTNAVRHAGADKLSVSITESAGAYRVEISDNGRVCAGPVTEGDGLSNLRRRLEQEGAVMNISYRDGVILTLELPCGKKRTGGQEK
jgi:anti-sigma regulatory factor (Ser/Thr protein kinase)